MPRANGSGWKLPDRIVVLLNDLADDGYDYKEISEALRLPRGTVSSRMAARRGNEPPFWLVDE